MTALQHSTVQHIMYTHLIEEISSARRLRGGFIVPLRFEHSGPQSQVLPLYEVPCKVLEESVLLGHLDEGLVTLTCAWSGGMAWGSGRVRMEWGSGRDRMAWGVGGIGWHGEWEGQDGMGEWEG